MPTTRRALVALALLLGLAACTPNQVAFWTAWHDTDPAAADAFLRDSWHPRGHCAQWYGYAIEAGFTDAEWDTVDRLMWAESRCDPDARNSSGASGLMQVMPEWFPKYGYAVADRFDPMVNLTVARAVQSCCGWR